MYRLIRPDLKYFESYRQACREWEQNGVFLYSFPDFAQKTPEQILQSWEDERNGVGLKPGYVPGSQFWLVDGEEVIGCGSIRHHLTDNLEKHGGHIGYAIRPSRQNQSCGTEQLKMLLKEAAAMGIKYALLTCDESNKASAAVMTKNNGGFIDTIINQLDGKSVRTRRCLIDTGLPIQSWSDPDFSFKELSRVKNNSAVELSLSACAKEIPERNYCPAYIFDIVPAGGNTKMGSIDLRIGKNEEIFYGGNIGYRVHEAYRGRHYAAQACKLLYPLALSHGMPTLEITCDPDNTASAKTCEQIGCRYLELVKLPSYNEQYALGQRFKRRYVVDNLSTLIDVPSTPLA